MLINRARPEEATYLAKSCIAIADFMREGAVDKYISGFPDTIGDEMVDWARAHTQSKEKNALIAKDDDGNSIGCIFGSITESNMPMAIAGKVGHISVCWVDSKSQRQGIGLMLLEALQHWFVQNGINHIEVAFMTQNTVAQKAWEQWGFSPFRTFAYKEIDV